MAVLKGGFANSLVTDVRLADRLLSLS